MTDQNIIFKNSKTGKVEQITANDIELVNFQKFVGSWGLRIFLKNGTLHRYGGFKEGVSIQLHSIAPITCDLAATKHDISYTFITLCRPLSGTQSCSTFAAMITVLIRTAETHCGRIQRVPTY